MHNRLKFFLAIIISILMIFFCVYAYPSLKESAQADILGDAIRERAKSSFSGVITVWQIDSFEGGINSRATWLQNALTRLEKRYKGVYFAVKSVTVELLPKLLKTGKPDVISFGGGVFSLDEAEQYFMPVEAPLGVLPALKSSAEGLACPLFFGGYCMLVAQEFTNKPEYKHGLSDFLGSDFGHVKHNKQSVRVSPLAAGGYNTSLVPTALCLGKGGLKCDIVLRQSEGLWDAYNYDRICAAATVTQRQLYRLKAATDKDKGRKSVVLPLYPYTDMVQYAAVFKGANDAKLRVIYSALEHLTSTEVQLGLGSIGLMPADLTALKGIAYDNPYMQSMCDFYKASPIRVPSAFADLNGVNQAALECIRGNASPEELLSKLYK